MHKLEEVKTYWKMKKDFKSDKKDHNFPSKNADIEKVTVNLKPLLGIPPERYLVFFYGVILLLILLIVLVAPGLKFNGSHIAYKSTPPGANIFINNKFSGVTPTTIRVPKGSYSLKISKTYFSTHESKEISQGRLLGSLFFPRTANFHTSLSVKSPQLIINNALLELSKSPHIPRPIIDAASDLSGQNIADDLIYNFLYNALILVETPEGMISLIQAHNILKAGGNPLSVSSLVTLGNEITKLIEEYHSFPIWLSALLPQTLSSNIRRSDWFREFLDNYTSTLQPPEKDLQTNTTNSLNPVQPLAEMFFFNIPPGDFIMGNLANIDTLTKRGILFEEWPHKLAINSIFVQQKEVTKAMFASFIAEVPEWAPTNKTYLIEKNLVTKDYLSDWNGNSPKDDEKEEPVVYVSAFAAEAFAKWISTKLPSQSGLIARLPTEPEWEYAARGGLVGELYPSGSTVSSGAHIASPEKGLLPVGQSTANGFQLKDMYGSVWEWTSDWYSPSEYFLSRYYERDYISDVRFNLGTKRSVRGGSFIDDPNLVKIHTRGSQPATWCTPVLGFRLVLAPK